MIKANSVLDLIGQTPLVRINNLVDPQGAELWAKLEYANPGSSIKDRIALRIVDDFKSTGALKPGGTLVEATSGNTGMGLTLVAAVRGYNTILVMPDKVSDEKRRLLRAMGAEVVICPTAVEADDPRSYYSVARKLAMETAGAVLVNQYFNPSNVEAHYTTTGPEIWEQTGGRLDAFVASIGTGGTITGVARYLKERDPRIKVWAGDPYGSVLKVYKDTGRLTKGHPYLVEGIGEDIIPGILDLELVDEIVNVNDEDSFHYSRLLAQKEGIFAGGSAGTIMKVALDVAAALSPDQVVVTLIPDTGERYLSKHHSDEWLRDKRMLRRETVTLQLLNQNKDGKIPGIVSVASTQTVRETLAKMSEHNISQMPVLDGPRNVGSLRESALLAGALEKEDFLERAVKDVMEGPFPTVDEHASVAHSTQLLLKHQGLVLTSNDIPAGFITRHDVINFSEVK